MPATYDLALAGLRVRWSAPEDGAAHLSLTGDLDNLSLPVFNQAIDRLWAGGTTDLVVDLAEMAFVDSGGLGALVAVWRRADDDGRAVSAVNPTPAVRDLLVLTGIDRYLLAD